MTAPAETRQHQRSEPGQASSRGLSDVFGSELLRQFGVTRVGDITDLDTLGIPVWFATRPNSRGLSVSQGKGLTSRQAQISAVMEAIEGAVAENVREHVVHFGSYRQLRQERTPAVPLAKLSRVHSELLDDERERAWVKGYSYRSGTAVLAPYELVGMDFRVSFPWDRQAFEMGSQGLAAGFAFEHALHHAILELVENDACFLLDTFGVSGAGAFECTFAPNVSADLDSALALVRKAGIEPIFIDLPRRFGVPVVFAAIPRFIDGASGPAARWSAGVACRVDPHEAALAALLEAAQSRLTDISGARDDLTDERYHGTLIEKALSSRGRTRVPAVVSRPASLEHLDDTARATALADHLLTSGLEDIYVFPLETGHPSIAVVRVVIPGLAVASATESCFHLGALHQFLQQAEAAE